MNKKQGLAAILACATLSLAACANPDDETAQGSVDSSGSTGFPIPAELEFEPDPELAALVPEQYREDGAIVSAVNTDLPPIKFTDTSGEITGVVPILFAAAGQLLDVEVEFTSTEFDALMPGLLSERYDTIPVADNADSQQQALFIDYLKYGQAVVVKPDSDLEIDGTEDLCGLSVAYLRGGTREVALEEIAADCESRGQSGPEGVAYQASTDALLALDSNNADTAWVDSPLAHYNATSSPDKYTVAHADYIGVYGIGFRKDEEDLVEAFQAALQHLAETGFYEEVLGDAGLPADDALPDFPINGGPELLDQ